MSTSHGNRIAAILFLQACLCACNTAGRDSGPSVETRVMTYWDGYGHGGVDSITAEQRIVDYLYIMGHCPVDARKDAWRIMHSRTGARIDRTIVDYLGDPDSPLRSDILLEEYLESLLEIKTDEVTRQRALYLLDGLHSTGTGRLIPDIRLRTTENSELSLLESVRSHDGNTMVMFYDPECPRCDEAIPHMTRLDTRSYGIRVIAISVSDSTSDFPDQYISAIITDRDTFEENFHITSLPIIFSLSNEGIILDKGGINRFQ